MAGALDVLVTGEQRGAPGLLPTFSRRVSRFPRFFAACALLCLLVLAPTSGFGQTATRGVTLVFTSNTGGNPANFAAANVQSSKGNSEIPGEAAQAGNNVNIEVHPVPKLATIAVAGVFLLLLIGIKEGSRAWPLVFGKGRKGGLPGIESRWSSRGRTDDRAGHATVCKVPPSAVSHMFLSGEAIQVFKQSGSLSGMVAYMAFEGNGLALPIDFKTVRCLKAVLMILFYAENLTPAFASGRWAVRCKTTVANLLRGRGQC
jgi:hypothetical protein